MNFNDCFFMFSRVINFFLCFFSALIVLSVWLGYLGFLSYSTATIIIFISFITGIAGTILVKNKEINPSKKTIIFFVLLTLILFGITLPQMVFPITFSDFMHHAEDVRIIGDTGVISQLEEIPTMIPFIKIHDYPQSYYAVTAVFYLIIGDSYVANTLLGIILFLLLQASVYLIAKKNYSEKIAFTATFISSLSVALILLLEYGYLPQVMGLFFLTQSIYWFSKKNKTMFFVSSIGMISYPPLILIELLFFVFYFALNSSFKKKDFLKEIFGIFPFFALFAGAFAIVFPETTGLLLEYIVNPARIGGSFLIRGGLFTPPIISLIVFLFALIPFSKYLTKKMDYRKDVVVLSMFLAALSSMLLVIIYYSLNSLVRFYMAPEVNQFYMALKFFYFLIVPLSILSAIGIDFLLTNSSKKKNEKILKTVFLAGAFLYLIYFFGYVVMLAQNPTNPNGYYSAVAKLTKSPDGTVIGVDDCFFTDAKKLEKPWFYSSFIHFPESGSIARYIEIGRDLHFYWATYEIYPTFEFRVLDKYRKDVLLLGNKVILREKPNVDYFVTTCSKLNYPVFYKAGEVTVYTTR